MRALIARFRLIWQKMRNSCAKQPIPGSFSVPNCTDVTGLVKGWNAALRVVTIAAVLAQTPLFPHAGGLAMGQPVNARQDWSTYNYDFVGSRYNASENTLAAENLHQLVEKWRFPPANSDRNVGVIHATPIVVNGYVYFGTATYPTFYKLSPDGQVKWLYELRPRADRRRILQQRMRLLPADGVFGSALVSDLAVFFADGRGVVHSLDRFTGQRNWTVDSTADDYPGAHPQNLFLASPIMANGKLILGGGAYEHAAVLMPGYKCCYGRGSVVAFDPESGDIIWKYDVGPKPQKFDPPLKLTVAGRTQTFHYGPSTSSVWCTPSYDADTNTLFFGTDVHNAPRRPTKDDPRLYTRHSAAIVALDAENGQEKWITQLTKGDIWNHKLPTYDPASGQYKDQSIGDTPKITVIDVDGQPTKVIGMGSKNGGFYVLRADDGHVLYHTPLYTDPPVENPEVDSRTLALPSAIGGLQTGCATDGHSFFTNGIDALRHFPTGGRVTSISLNARFEYWRHERPKVPQVPRRNGKAFDNVGDPVASGIAVANGFVCFTTLVSNKLVFLDKSDGSVLNEIALGPVFSGPSISRGRIYVGTGNTLFSPNPAEDFFPKRYTGVLHCFGLPMADEVDRMGSGNE